MILITIFLPLISSLICGFFSNQLKRETLLKLSVLTMFINTLIILLIFIFFTLKGSVFEIICFEWITSEYLIVKWGFLFDSLTMVMLLLVNIISTIVHLYSTEYMQSDPHITRFMSYLSLFTFFMFILVSANNFVQLFVGWEGVGLCSYLLIGFWFTRIQANKSALKALIMNRIGDFMFIVGVSILFMLFKSTDFAIIFNNTVLEWVYKYEILNKSNEFFSFNKLKLASLCLFLGAVGKSAQIGLHTWLPDAMEGPTPVSALIHAATMVTAGVFLIIRTSAVFELCTDICVFISVIGVFTAIFAGTIGLLQYDIKKIIAYSTCSQLGYMVFSCGLHQYTVSLFHLVNHAFFKALLFLAAGAIIHALNDEQDIRKMGGLLNILPFSYTVTLIGSLSLAGFPFLTGFYSKDIILEIMYGSYTTFGKYAFWFGLIAAFLTAFYSARLLYFVFLTNTNAFKKIILAAHEPGLAITFSLFFLAINSIFFGYVFKDMFVGESTNFLNNSIYVNKFNTFYDVPFNVPVIIKLLPLVFSFTGIIVALILNIFWCEFLTKLKFLKISRLLFLFFNKRWFFDTIYNYYIATPILKSGYTISYKLFDKGLIEFLGPYGATIAINYLGKKFSIVQNGLLSNGLKLFILGLFLSINIILLICF